MSVAANEAGLAHTGCLCTHPPDVCGKWFEAKPVLILEILKCGGSSLPCPKNVGAWSIKMGTFTSAKEGLISEPSVCPYVCYAPVPPKD